jgi:membrane-associated phospholipid phosphatase
MGFRPGLRALLACGLVVLGRPAPASAQVAAPPSPPAPAKPESVAPAGTRDHEDELVKQMLTSEAEEDDLAWLYSNADEYSPSGLTGEPIPAPDLPTRGGGSPRRWDPRWHKFGTENYVLTGVGFAAGLGAYFVPPSKTPWQKQNSFDEWGRRTFGAATYEASRTAQDVSDVLLSLNVAYPLLVDALIVSYWYRRSPEVATQIGLISLEAMAVGSMLQGPTAAFASRERPYGRECGKSIPANLDDCESRDRYRSYFSGHTTIAFASATVTCSHHARHDLFGDELADGIACGAAVTSAATVGAMRIAGNKHYITDVATGAAVGTLSGLAVPWLLHYGPLARVATPVANSSIRLTLLPLPGGIAAGGTF